jgi:hypothetical protein
MQPGPGDDEYRQDASGNHNPYPTNPYGGEPEIPDDEHFHTLDFGKARVGRPHPFMVVIEHDAH